VADSDSKLAREIRRDDDQLNQLHKSMRVWAREEIPWNPESAIAADSSSRRTSTTPLVDFEAIVPSGSVGNVK